MTMESLTGIHAYRGANEGLEGSWVVRSGGQNQEIVMMEGYGYRNIDKSLPVTSETLFAIGSSTKAFTALALESLRMKRF